MKVAYLTGEYPRATDTFVQREVAALRELGLEVSTFAIRRPDPNELVGPEQREEVERTCYVLPIAKNPLKLLGAHARLLLQSPGRYVRSLGLAARTGQPGLAGAVYQLFYFLEAGVLASKLQEQGVDRLHNHFANSSCSVSMLASALSGKPFSFTLHGPAIFFEPYRWALGEKLRRASFVSVISRFCRSQAMIFCPRSEWAKLHIVHCGVDPSLFAPRQHEGTGKRILFVGRLAAVKGLPMLLEAMVHIAAAISDAELVLVGDGPDREALEREADRLGIAANVRFAGYRSQSEVRELLAESDVLMMASFAEGVPVVLMEALAAGVPVVATQIAGVGELVEEGVNGYLVPPSDADQLASRGLRLLRDAGLRQSFGQAGRAKVEREFDIYAEAARLKQCLLGEKPSGRGTDSEEGGEPQTGPARGTDAGAAVATEYGSDG